LDFISGNTVSVDFPDIVVSAITLIDKTQIQWRATFYHIFLSTCIHIKCRFQMVNVNFERSNITIGTAVGVGPGFRRGRKPAAATGAGSMVNNTVFVEAARAAVYVVTAFTRWVLGCTASEIGSV